MRGNKISDPELNDDQTYLSVGQKRHQDSSNAYNCSSVKFNTYLPEATINYNFILFTAMFAFPKSSLNWTNLLLFLKVCIWKENFGVFTSLAITKRIPFWSISDLFAIISLNMAQNIHSVFLPIMWMLHAGLWYGLYNLAALVAFLDIWSYSYCKPRRMAISREGLVIGG